MMTNKSSVDTFWKVYFILMIPLLFGLINESAGDCTCYPKHPQQHFCDSDFVIRGRVIASDIALPVHGHNISDEVLMSLPPEVINSAGKVWTVRTSHVYKGRSFLFPEVNVKFYTPLFDGRCGVNHIQKDKVYIIMGTLDTTDGTLNFDFCNWHRKWTDVTARQKKGFRSIYKQNCGCHVHTCGIGSVCGEREKKFHNVCDWDAFTGGCYNRHAACTKTDKGTCGWVYPKEHKDCVFPSR